MSELKIGNRVRVISDPKFIERTGAKSIIGMTGTVKTLSEISVGVEFDVHVGGHSGNWNGKDGYCWYVKNKYLEKIEDTEEETKEEVNEETKADTLEQKILEVLRKEIGVEAGEEFYVYENDRKKWICKFEKSGHLVIYKRGGFEETFIWKYWIFHFDKYVFKKKTFLPRKEEPYFYVQMRLDDNGNAIYNGVDYVYWYGKDFDIAMLITGNYFKTEEEAEDNKEKVIEKMNKLLKDE